MFSCFAVLLAGLVVFLNYVFWAFCLVKRNEGSTISWWGLVLVPAITWALVDLIVPEVPKHTSIASSTVCLWVICFSVSLAQWPQVASCNLSMVQTPELLASCWWDNKHMLNWDGVRSCWWCLSGCHSSDLPGPKLFSVLYPHFCSHPCAFEGGPIFLKFRMIILKTSFSFWCLPFGGKIMKCWVIEVCSLVRLFAISSDCQTWENST